MSILNKYFYLLLLHWTLAEPIKQFVKRDNTKHYTDVHGAARLGKLDFLNRLIEEQHFDVNIRGEFGDTPLHIAAGSGKLETVKYLVEHGAKVNIANNYDNLPLHDAVIEGKLDVVKYLIGVKKDYIDERGEDGSTPLHFAVTEGDLEMCRFLIEKGADVILSNDEGNTPLHVASQLGHLDIVKYIIENSKIDINNIGQWGYTALHWAVHKGHLEIVKYLISKGADVNFVSTGGYLLLHWASYTGHLNIVKYFVETLKFNVNVKSSKGNTPLHNAAYEVKPEVVRYLLQNGADCIVNKNKDNPLHVAAYVGCTECVEDLIEHCKNLNVDDKGLHGKTALYSAASGGYLDIVIYLVENWANVHLSDDEGKSPIAVAVQEGHASIVSYLKKHRRRVQ